jgi:transcriptional regulator with XRE-family HTH domain
MNQEKIGKFIKNIRINNNLTQKEFADKFGVTYQAVSKWENGKNLPDINILKEICREYSISLDEVIGDKKNIGNKNNNRFIIILLLILIVGVLVCLFWFNNKGDDFQFKTLTSTCENFKVTGSLAYNDSKSSIYISHVDYCGGDDDVLYKSLSCVFYEVDSDVKKEISRYVYAGDEGVTLEKFLSDVSFNVDNYSKVCKLYQENSFLLEVDVMNGEDTFTYKIPLKLEDNC